MKISAFTIIKNSLRFDYPVIESINSLLPFVDEYVINVGMSDDGTLELISKYFGNNAKCVIFKSKWEDVSRGVSFFSNQTNNALSICSGDWCFYLQADECVHEDIGKSLRTLIAKADLDNKIAISCKYYHFEKDYNNLRKTYADGFDCYEEEIRIIKNNGTIFSWGDAQGFCKISDMNQPLMHHEEDYIKSNIYIYHYGYVKPADKMLDKKKHLSGFYDVSEPNRKEKIPEKEGKYVYSENLKPFSGNHPRVMIERISKFRG